MAKLTVLLISAGTALMDIGNGVVFRNPDTVALVAEGNQSPAQIAEALVCAGKHELVEQIEYVDEEGNIFGFNAMNAQPVLKGHVSEREAEEAISGGSANGDEDAAPVLAKLAPDATKHTVKDAMGALYVRDLQAIAKELGLEIPREANRKDEIIAFIQKAESTPAIIGAAIAISQPVVENPKPEGEEVQTTADGAAPDGGTVDGVIGEEEAEQSEA